MVCGAAHDVVVKLGALRCTRAPVAVFVVRLSDRCRCLARFGVLARTSSFHARGNAPGHSIRFARRLQCAGVQGYSACLECTSLTPNDRRPLCPDPHSIAATGTRASSMPIALRHARQLRILPMTSAQPSLRQRETRVEPCFRICTTRSAVPSKALSRRPRREDRRAFVSAASPAGCASSRPSFGDKGQETAA